MQNAQLRAFTAHKNNNRDLEQLAHSDEKKDLPPSSKPSTRVIEFYAATGPYGAFSNFSRHHVELKGKVWPTSEHYYQAQKFAGTVHEEEIRVLAKPMLAAQAGRARSRPMRADWEDVKESVMLEVLRAKFTQHKPLLKLLLSTRDAVIVEASPTDYYWGRGADGSGRNRLGYLLMLVRRELQNAANGNQENNTPQPAINAIVTPSKVNLKASKRKKLRGRVNAFVDADGSAKIERSNGHRGAVEINGTGPVIRMSAAALPAAGHLAIYRARKSQTEGPSFSDGENDSADDDDHELSEEDNYSRPVATAAILADFVVTPARAHPHMTLKLSTSPPSGKDALANRMDIAADLDSALKAIAQVSELRNANTAESELSPLFARLSALKRNLCSSMESSLEDSVLDQILTTVDAINRALTFAGHELVL